MITTVIGWLAIIVLVAAAAVSYVGSIVIATEVREGEEVESSPLQVAMIAGACTICVLVTWIIARFTPTGFLVPLILSIVFAVLAFRFAGNGVPMTLPICLLQVATAIAAGIAMSATGKPELGSFVKFAIFMILPIIATLIAAIVFGGRAYYSDSDGEDLPVDDEPEPEYVDINSAYNQLAAQLEEARRRATEQAAYTADMVAGMQDAQTAVERALSAADGVVEAQNAANLELEAQILAAEQAVDLVAETADRNTGEQQAVAEELARSIAAAQAAIANLETGDGGAVRARTRSHEKPPVPWGKIATWTLVAAGIGVVIWIYAAFFVPAFPELNILNLFR